MVAIKGQLVSGFLKSPDPRHQAYLFYGSDAGLVSERAAKLANLLAERENPAGEVISYSESDFENDPDRLALELSMLPMFGGRKIVRTSTGRRVNANTLKPILEGGALEGILIVEAANLGKDDALRLLFEGLPAAAAIACYGDDVQDIHALVREVLGQHGLSITSDAQEALASRLGADRSLSRTELEKLALYAHGQKTVEAADVEAIVGDAAELAIDQILLAAASGDGGRAIVECQRTLASGEDAQKIIAAAQRYFQRLHRIRLALDQGKSFDSAVQSLRPPLFFKQKPAVSAHTRIWSSAALAEALLDIAETAKSARLSPALEDAHLERLLMKLARKAAFQQKAKT
jgi:DNA polymerase-3 subunit delta